MAFTKITAAGIGSTETVTLDGLSVINDGSFGGNVSIAGTLTYEDVTNVDSVGLITARNGIVVGSGITLSKDGDGFFTGIITATFAGDGSSLTGVANTDVIFPDKISFGDGTATDGDQLNVGVGSDLTIFHTSSGVSKIEESNAGLHIRQINDGDIHIHAGANTGSSNNRLVARSSGAAELYHSGSKKLETTNTGAVVTGICTATSFSGDGSALTGIASVTDINNLINNVAMLGFKVATNGSLAVYDLVDQRVDEFKSAAGIDASASTDETYVSGSGGYYHGTVSTPNYPTGGTVTTYGSYRVHSFTNTGDTNFVVPSGVSGSVDYLIVGGGGGGGDSSSGEGDGAGGGGAGGVYAASGVTLSAATYTATVGAGGGGGQGNDGGDSSFNSITAGGGGSGGNDGEGEAGGDGAGRNGRSGTQGGSGGGSGNRTSSNGGSAGSGGSNANSGGGGAYRSDAGHGGGGAGEAGSQAPGNTSGGDGGDGITNDYRTGSAVYYGGGGGGGIQSSGEAGSGGQGGGGSGGRSGNAVQDGTANTGGGGGGGSNQGGFEGGDGGSGIVVVRYATTQFTTSTAGADITLQSTDATAKDGAPSTADLIMLIDNGAGTTTENTDIKAFISRDSGSNFTQGTLVDEGLWTIGDSLKRILAFHNLDISGQPSGTSICYKITTHNQSASKDTQIHAVSYGWK